MQFITPKVLILATAVILIAAVFIVIGINQEKLPTAISIHTEGQPTIGYPKAPVHVIVFEEPKCPDCKSYNNTVFPRIKKEFIDTNKIRYTVIPVSFLPHSMPAAVAWLCVYNQELEYPNRDLFFSYIDYMYAHQPPEHFDWAIDSTLQKFAKEASPAIDIERLKGCVDRESYRIQIEKNTEYGASLMDGELSTPTIFIDGMRLDDVSYNSISKLIQSALREHGG